jgi:hypothetical protein
MWMPFIKVKGSEATTEEAFVADQDHQEVVVEVTMEATEVVSNETKNLAKISKIEGIPTILNQDLKTNRQRPLIKGATMDKTMTEEDLTLLDSKTVQENGVLIVKKLHTTQLNVGATKRKLSMTSMMTKMNNLKRTKKAHLIATRFNHSSKQKLKIDSSKAPRENQQTQNQ